MGLKPNEQDHGHIHGIVYDNLSIFGTWVYRGMGNNIVKLSFQISLKI